MNVPDDVLLDLLSEGIETDLGLWEFFWMAEERFSASSPTESSRIALSILRELLQQGLIEAGDMDTSSHAFQAWNLAPEGALRRIEEALRFIDRPPRSGEIAWFTTTPAGAKRRQEIEKLKQFPQEVAPESE